ncbi:hypothetical protein JKF63_06049 [Porcisia hertigi]|uniref:Transglutaminase-like domain-containing protein n=1 Tax=Porcisia hertigi TaxID=2761500 RepID=A0A836ICY4_9TRYP|nr:hypothetical protein JKF63_06049 [Porcisia hertigi]
MKAANTPTAAAQAKAAAQAEAAAATAAMHSSRAFLEYGASLYEVYTHLPEDATARLPHTRYADYLHHFGFSIERESKIGDASVTAVAAAAHHKGKSHAKTQAPRGDGWGMGVDVVSPCDPDGVAGWGLPEALRAEADSQCCAVGALRDATEWTVIAEQLAAPFMTVTWRQTATQCAIKKARCVYMWLCSHMTLQTAVPEAEVETNVNREKASVSGRSASQQSASLPRKSPRVARKVKDVATSLEPADPPDALLVSLQTRCASAPLLATVYMRMLASVGVSCEVVVGQLKGAAPEESFEWSWNIVAIDGKQYLVDVSAALSNGVLRRSPSPTDASASEVSLEANKGHRGANASFRGKAAAPLPTFSLEAGTLPSNESVQLLPFSPEGMRRNFFFFAHPTAFLVSHLPTDPAKTLVQTTAMLAEQWAQQPRPTPALYHYGLQLASHQTRSVVVATKTPVYISLVNPNSSKVELCCVLYAGTLQSLPEDLSKTTPLGAEWVWHQREESTSTDTFTLTVPQPGYYVVVLGARPIRADPYSAAITLPGETAFTPVVSYEIRIGFTLKNSPVLPRQYLSPSVCRLIAPLCSQLLPGKNHFCVMPSCSNVLAVAVVNYAVSTATRTLLAFLPFQPYRAAFEGPVDVRVGDNVEVWVLYGAPDRHGQPLRQRVALAAPPEPPVSPSASTPSIAGSKLVDKKKKGAAALEQQQQIAAETQLTLLVEALRRGEVFQRCFGGIEVRHFLSPAVVDVIEPQPTVEQEQGNTLRQLVGVTSALFCEADEIVRHQPDPVGGYFRRVTSSASRS